MAQWAESLLSRHENLSLIPSILLKKQKQKQKASTAEAKTGESLVLTGLDKLMSSGPAADPTS